MVVSNKYAIPILHTAERNFYSYQKLKTGTFIVRIPTHYPFDFFDSNGPYKSVRAIKRNSPIYKLLKTTNLKRAQQIVDEKNIITIDKLIVTPTGTEFKPTVVDGFIHATIGRIKKGDLTGFHFFDPEKVKILEMIELNKQTNVFQARFQFYDVRTKKWIERRVSSTFFPRNWNLATLLMECKFAFDKLNEKDLKDGKIKSLTQSNIEVEMIKKTEY